MKQPSLPQPLPAEVRLSVPVIAASRRIRSIDGGWATRGRFSVARADRTDGHRLTPGLTVAGHGRDPRRGLGIDAGLPAEIRDPSGMVITMYNVSA